MQKLKRFAFRSSRAQKGLADCRVQDFPTPKSSHLGCLTLLTHEPPNVNQIAKTIFATTKDKRFSNVCQIERVERNRSHTWLRVRENLCKLGVQHGITQAGANERLHIYPAMEPGR